MKVRAEEVEDGMFLPPSFDNGYVFDVETGDVTLTTQSDTHYVSLGEMTVITFHDSLGNEQYLVLHPDFEIEVSR